MYQVKPIHRKAVAGILVAAVLMAGAFAYSQAYDPSQELPKPTVLQKRLEKLGRGLSNVLFGWTEIPLTWNEHIQRKRPLTEIIATGTVKGTAKAFIRTGTGVYEVFTFYFKNPSGDYEPIIEPDYLF